MLGLHAYIQKDWSVWGKSVLLATLIGLQIFAMISTLPQSGALTVIEKQPKTPNKGSAGDGSLRNTLSSNGY